MTEKSFAKARVTEAELIEGARQGDEAAWASLMRQHQEGVFRLAYLLVGDADDAEDVAQEVFIRAHRRLARFDTSRPMRPWLLRITSNLAHNRRRAAGRYRAALRRAAQLVPPSTGASVEQATTQRDTASELWQAVQRLNTKDRDVIYLRYFLELSVSETAATLNVAPGTVKSRLHRALRRLREVVAQEFPTLREGWTDDE